MTGTQGEGIPEKNSLCTSMHLFMGDGVPKCGTKVQGGFESPGMEVGGGCAALAGSP
jgi:hypothetical protein